MFQASTKLQQTDQQFSLDLVIQGARDEAGLQEFGDDDFIEPLRMLIESAIAELPFTEVGLLNFRATLQRFLVNRLRFHHDLTRHPEILDEDVSDPIVVLGMPRTGTTKLQRVLSADPGNQALWLWRLLNPAPFPNEAESSPSGRMAFAEMVEQATKANADFVAAHETAAREADEDSYLLLLSCAYDMLHNIFPADSYLAWIRARSDVPAHRYERSLLQYLQWQDGGRRGRRWILKNPGAVGHLEALHETFPKATYIYSHRDMREVLPSFCRLMEAIYAPLYDTISREEIGRKAILFWAPAMAKFAAARAKLAGQIDLEEVSYLDIVNDPVAIARRLYSRAGIIMNAAGEAAMRAWERDNQQHKFGKLDYSLEGYGLTEADIAQAFPRV